MDAYKLRAYVISSVGLFINAECFEQVGLVATKGCRQHSCSSMPRMQLRRAEKSIDRIIHKVVPAAAMNMNVDKTGRNVFASCVEFGCTGRIDRFAGYFRNFTVDN